jgi:phospholipase C
MREEKLTDSFVLENTYHWPADGESRPWTEFWVTTFSRPVGRVKSASILNSIHQGQHWEQRRCSQCCP